MTLKNSQKLEDGRYELEIAIDAAEFDAAINTVYKKEVKKININGWRKGKAPRGLIERTYGENVFYEDALNELYPKVMEEAADEAGIEIVDFKNVDFDLVSIGKEGAEFKVKVTVKPEIEIDDYKGLKATKPIEEVTDEEIDEEIKGFQNRNARTIEITDRAVEDGDITIIDYHGFCDGEAFDGGKAENQSLTIGSNTFIPGFEEQIIGKSIGEDFDVNVKFPDEYHAENLKGKDAVFKVKLHEIKKRELPEVDDEFVKDISEFDTVDDFKKDLSEKALKRKEEDADKRVEGMLINELEMLVNADIPEAMVELEIDNQLREMDYKLRMQGLGLAQYMQYMQTDAEGIRENFKTQAMANVKTALALEYIAKNENLAPTDEEIEEEYAKYVELYKTDIDKVKKTIPQKDVVKELLFKNAVKFLVDNAKITYEK